MAEKVKHIDVSRQPEFEQRTVTLERSMVAQRPFGLRERLEVIPGAKLPSSVAKDL